MITEEAFEKREAEIGNDYMRDLITEIFKKRKILRLNRKLINYSNAYYFDNLLLTIKCLLKYQL